MRIQYARMWFLRDRKCKSKSEAWEDELVHQNGNREVIRWLPFSPDSPCPLCSEPCITSSVHSNAKSLSSPSPGGSSSPRLLFSLRFPCILVQLGLLTLPPSSPHHPKMWSYLIGRKTRSEPWIHFSLFFRIKSELMVTLARSFRMAPASPALSSLSHSSVMHSHFEQGGEIFAFTLHAFHFSLLAVLPCPSTASGNFLLHHDTFSDILNN